MNALVAQMVRPIVKGESLAELINECKARTWAGDAEHAVIVLQSGVRCLVKGGPKGIAFSVDQSESELFLEVVGQYERLDKVICHTHPRVTGPSAADLRMLSLLGQPRFYLVEIGGEPGGTLVRSRRGAS